jgi:TPR repeat protein
MKRQITTILLTLIGLNTFGQTADELSQQAIQFLQTGEFEKAVPLLEQAAELGSAEAQSNLGYSYITGMGIETNAELAIKWFSKSADQGHNDALYFLMMIYGNGEGVEPDSEKAFYYALKCAENGDGTCMWNVANCYYDGTGVEKNIDKMVEWSTRLAKFENPENLAKSGYITSARLRLAYMYRDGTYLEQDFFKSYQWFLIYNEFKRDFSYFKQQQTLKELKELEGKLTTEQKENGQKEAENILGRPLRNMENLYKAEM